ncbi:M15 family metallopeptidase [Pendulispora rubella]|uniref:M15 family metallopeptidase n=1 Tax=Pendulispora rubella TaxID=2741070 RepID=A0ABZ2LKK5_9BACT
MRTLLCLGLAVGCAIAAGCSSSSNATPPTGDEAKPPVLRGSYKATSAGPISELAFVDATHYLSWKSPCERADEVAQIGPDACLESGTFAVNAARDRLTLTSASGKTTQLPFQARDGVLQAQGGLFDPDGGGLVQPGGPVLGGFSLDGQSFLNSSTESLLAPAMTVEQAVDSGCSTVTVLGLSRQIVSEVNCLVPNALTPVDATSNQTRGEAVFAYLQPPAAKALGDALAANPNTTMRINSMLRGLPQQYLLRQWHLAGRCSITAAATPGASNHEQGLAIDIGDNATWKEALEGASFQWFGPGDRMHFTYVGADTVELRGKDVLAFQRLWNRNHPDEPTGEDGDYGPDTEKKLKAAPANGFEKGASCS